MQTPCTPPRLNLMSSSPRIFMAMSTSSCLVYAPSFWTMATRQSLTLVHFSAQPEPILTQNAAYTPPSTP